MQRTRSASTPETLRLQRPVTSNAFSVSIADVNQLGIRILGLKSIPVKEGARLMAFLECTSALQRMPERFIPLLAGELGAAYATLPTLQQRDASNALNRVTSRSS